MKSQKLRITFQDNDTVNVESDYVFTVYDNDVIVEVQYIFGSSYYFLEGGPHYVNGIEDFAVALDGRAVGPDNISYYVIEPEAGYPGDYTAVFPFDFGRAGEHRVKLSYSFDVPGGVAGIKNASIEQGHRYGFVYDIEPLQYWAGEVHGIRVDVVLENLSITDFELIWPSDFVFTSEGCRWEWRDLTDERLSEDGRIELFFGKAGSLFGNFTEVLREGGMEVYLNPMPNSKVIKTLEQGERVYLYKDADDENLTDVLYERGWRKCRLLDNTEGYVITWLPEYFFESFDRRKIMWNYPAIYGEEKP